MTGKWWFEDENATPDEKQEGELVKPFISLIERVQWGAGGIGCPWCGRREPEPHSKAACLAAFLMGWDVD